MVDVQPQRGTFVFQYDARELREICELREVLETGALRIALKHHRAELIQALGAQVAAIDGAGPLEPRAYQPFDAAFHDALVRGSDNNELIDAYGRISGRIRAIRHRLTRRPEQVTASHHVHVAILRAIEDGKDHDAEAHLVEHVYTNYRRLLASTAAGISNT
jgi:DNA-binding GntR family transcriptional regulator